MSEHDDTAAFILACTSVIIASVGAAAAIISSHEYKRKRQHKVWVRHYIIKREKFGAYNRLLPELSVKFHNYLRMDVDTFEQLFLLVEPELKRKKTWMR